MHKLEDINGNEIIDFLNKLTTNEENDSYCDMSIIGGSYTFVNQSINNNCYKLQFNGDFNNWGTHQTIEFNYIYIFKNGEIKITLEEPFDSDETADILEDTISKWLKSHAFESDTILISKFNNIITETCNLLHHMDITDTLQMQEAINQLVKARTLMK